MPYTSSVKRRDLSAGVVPDPAVNALSAASMAASGPASLGDGAESTGLVPQPAESKMAKATRFLP